MWRGNGRYGAEDWRRLSPTRPLHRPPASGCQTRGTGDGARPAIDGDPDGTAVAPKHAEQLMKALEMRDWNDKVQRTRWTTMQPTYTLAGNEALYHAEVTAIGSNMESSVSSGPGRQGEGKVCAGVRGWVVHTCLTDQNTHVQTGKAHTNTHP